MYKSILRLLSVLLVLVMLVNMLPVSAFAATAETGSEMTSATQEVAKEASIVAELSEKRTEYSKEFRLSNGLHMAVVYGEPVHFEEDGAWAEIDNTLKSVGTGTEAVLTNTAGVWDVQFPRQMSDSNAVTITKDGYTLSFFMAGQLRNSPGELQTATAEIETFALGKEAFGIQAASAATAQVRKIDFTQEKAEIQHPETVVEKNYSRIAYSNLYANTDVVYDLASNQVKESIIIGEYDSSLRGYRYILNVGKMVPVLTEENEIILYDENREKPVMVMPAPYLEDGDGAYSDDITVTLTGKGDTWTLAYTLPQGWMAAKDRAYPVVLDPVVTADYSKANIEDVSVYQIDPLSYTTHRLDVGKNTAHGITRAFIKFLTLPKIDPRDVIVEANLALFHFDIGTSPVAIGAHKVLEDWTDSTMTWDNQPEYEKLVSEHCIPDAEGVYNWSITEIARGWYEENNYGLVLRVSDARENATTAKSSLHQIYSENSIYHPPTLTITFRSITGLESYYTYATLSAGNAGGVYISDSIGQVTATRAIASYASGVNPFSASLVYNSIHFAENNTLAGASDVTLGLPMDFGAGWTLDVIQKIESYEQDPTYLVYWDGDGTSHYFKKSSGTYYDEDGLGLKIVANNDGSYTMSDAMDNKWFFTALNDTTGRYLTASEDNNGNRYEMTYNTEGHLTAIQQKNRGQDAIIVAALHYDGNRVTGITDASGNCQRLTYTANKLTGISQNSTAVAQYGYDGYRLSCLTDVERDYTIELEYYPLPAPDGDSEEEAAQQAENGEKPGRVSSYQEKVGDTEGVRCDIYYYGITQTVYHDYGNDRTSGTADDLYSHYMLDYAGRTVNAYTTDHTGTNILGASTALYTDNNGINKKNNRTLRTASIGVAAQKLLTQGGFENTSDNWTFSGASAAKTKPRTGLYSMKAVMSAATAEAAATRTSMPLIQGEIYTLSAYVNTSVVTSLTGAGVSMKITESNGTVHTSEAVDYITNSSIDKGWVRIAMTFTAAASGATTVSIQGTGMVGTFYADDVQLEKGEAPSNYNMLENGDFQAGSTAVGWGMDDKASLFTGIGVGLGRSANDSAAQSMKFQNAEEDIYAIAYQDVNINKTGLQSYVISGWAMANAVPDNITVRSSPAYDHTKQFGIRATISYADGTKDYCYVPFNADVTGWQYASLTVIPPSTVKKVTVITISCVYETNANIAYFDNMSMVEETVNVYTYNDNGDPTSASTTGLNSQSVTYDSHGNVKTVVQKTGSGSADKITTTYTYDSTFVHRMVSSTNGVTTQTLTHDGVGNVLTSTLKGKSGKKIASSTAYSDDGNRTATVTDSAGNTTSYAYSNALYEMLGQASTVTDARGTQTAYTLDDFGRVTNMTLASLASLGYTYNDGMLDALTRTAGNSSQTYQFTYDGFGNTTRISVGDSLKLASYNYGSKNGLLTSQAYGNGDSVSFTYDNLGRVKTTTYSDGRILTYRYTGDGQLYAVQDSETGLTYQYSYDSQGRLMASSVKNADGNVLTTRQTYDANNQMTAQYWQMGSDSYSEVYTYNLTTGLLATHTPAVGSKRTYTYDVLQRLSKVTGGVYGKTYTYRDVSDTHTTTQVAGLTYDLPTDITYGYTYDVLGNIATYTQGDTTYSYTYDAQNQLLSQTDGTNTWTYTYDAAGNILTSSDGTTSHSYTYGNSTWKDLLTAVDGHAITYEQGENSNVTGNPISYYNGTSWTFDWEEGRRLVSASNGTTNLTYTYDSEGLRLSKTVDGVVHNYYYAGGKLLRETWGSNTLDFFYDAMGTAYAVKYNGTLYYYITNLQGDILHIVNTSGTPVVSYTYSPYGKVLSTTGTLASTLGVDNPLRYRGYYYDTDSGLYYLQSRYYDPELCRFINADSYTSTGQGIIGCNMFVYCLNNPINRVDIQGTVSCDPEYEWLGELGKWLAEKLEEFAKKLNEDAEKYDKENTDTSKVYEANYYSSYNGTVVIRHDSNILSSWAFGSVIFLNHDGDNSTYAYQENTLKHEYGHIQQEKAYGTITYSLIIMTPSMITNVLSRFDDDMKEKYYSMPWEYDADLRGGVERDHKDWAEDTWDFYFAYWGR